MKKMSFYNIHNKRLEFLNEHKNKSFSIITGTNNFLISASHGVSQTRNGQYKYAEPGSLATALYLQHATSSFLIAKTRNDFDDANFDQNSQYKNKIKDLLLKNKIDYVIDIHGLAKKRECDINFGTNIGKNVNLNITAFNELENILKLNNFNLSIDQPFMGSGNTISAYCKTVKPNIFSLQIEINCSITNYKENFEKYKRLLDCLETWIKNHVNSEN